MGTVPRSLLEALAAAACEPDRDTAAGKIAALVRAEWSYRWVGVYEVGDDEISVLGWSGPNPPAVPRFPRNRGLCGRAVASRATVTVGDVTRDADYLTTLDSTRSEIVVPVLTSSMQPLGLIDVESADLDAFDAADRERLAACASAIRPLWGP